MHSDSMVENTSMAFKEYLLLCREMDCEAAMNAETHVFDTFETQAHVGAFGKYCKCLFKTWDPSLLAAAVSCNGI